MTTTGAPARAPRTLAEPGLAAGHQSLVVRDNALNLIRLVLAAAVLVFHAYPLGGLGTSPAILGVGLGGWAVAGFFCLSGYLIQASRDSKPIETYLTLRIARIFPAYWVCLVVTAFALAPVAYVLERGSLDGFLTTGGTTPGNYVLTNAFLKINSYAVGDTLSAVPYPVAWNGSLWTLYYEFLCYLAVAVLTLWGVWRRRAAPAVVAWAATAALHVGYEHVAPYVGHDPHVANLVMLAPYFFAGVAVYRLRHRLPLTWWGAAISVAVICSAALLSPAKGPQLSAIALAYLLLWLGHVLPSPRWTQRNDISYGVYIYAFPVQQLLAVAGVHTWGAAWYIATAAIGTAILAVASWYWLERPLLRMTRTRLATRTVTA